jgi:hypothetical protein
VTAQADLERRNALLDELKEAVDDWADAEEEKVNKEIDFMKSVLRGRTGSERLARSNTEEARVLVIDDIDSFLTGDGAT